MNHGGGTWPSCKGNKSSRATHVHFHDSWRKVIRLCLTMYMITCNPSIFSSTPIICTSFPVLLSLPFLLSFPLLRRLPFFSSDWCLCLRSDVIVTKICEEKCQQKMRRSNTMFALSGHTLRCLIGSLVFSMSVWQDTNTKVVMTNVFSSHDAGWLAYRMVSTSLYSTPKNDWTAQLSQEPLFPLFKS